MWIVMVDVQNQVIEDHQFYEQRFLTDIIVDQNTIQEKIILVESSEIETSMENENKEEVFY